MRGMVGIRRSSGKGWTECGPRECLKWWTLDAWRYLKDTVPPPLYTYARAVLVLSGNWIGGRGRSIM
jgi:hypothetical protein